MGLTFEMYCAFVVALEPPPQPAIESRAATATGTRATARGRVRLRRAASACAAPLARARAAVVRANAIPTPLGEANPALFGGAIRTLRGEAFSGTAADPSEAACSQRSGLFLAERLLVHAIALDDTPAHAFHRTVHGGIGLEDPAHLAARLARGGGGVEVFEVE